MAHSALPYISFLSSFSLKKHPAYKRVLSLYCQLVASTLTYHNVLGASCNSHTFALRRDCLFLGRQIQFFNYLLSKQFGHLRMKKRNEWDCWLNRLYKNVQIQNRCGLFARAAISSACWKDLTDPFPSLLEIWCSILGSNARIVSERVVEGGRSIAACYLELGEKVSALCLWQGRYLLAID